MTILYILDSVVVDNQANPVATNLANPCQQPQRQASFMILFQQRQGQRRGMLFRHNTGKNCFSAWYNEA